MSRVKSKDTTPELEVRRLAHALGYRFRTHTKFLPGKPDLVFTRRKKVVFVHGCFWHRHPGCSKATTPKSRTQYWREKFDRNVERDEKVMSALKGLGWDVLIIWQCEIKRTENLQTKLEEFLGPKKTVDR
jgi:DNA mismatch endonuclease (patch repair protein)